MKRRIQTPAVAVRVALIGCGRMGLQHLKAIARVPGAVVVAIADPAADVQAVNRIVGSEVRIFADAAHMLRDAAPQVVHIVTPPHTHARLAKQALEAGCHVYLEKPFTATVAEARELLELADARGLLACAGHQCLFEFPALRAIELLPRIGRVVHVASHFSFRMVRRTLTPVEQCKDILPHAVYPLLQQLRRGAGATGAPIELAGCVAHAFGDLYALLRHGDSTGIVQVTLSGRPVEQFQEIVATNGALRADYVTGSVTRLYGPGTGPGALLTPFRRGSQTLGAAIRLFFRVLSGRNSSYAGLHEIIRRFYEGIAGGKASPVPPADILDTVDICERLGAALDQAQAASEMAAHERLRVEVAGLTPAISPAITLVTGGTGFLGREVAAELRHAGMATRVVSRRLPPPSKQIAGVEYATSDLATGLDADLLRNVDTIVHCAAETAGGAAEHERNSVEATRQLLLAAAKAGVRRVVHVSSLAVLRPSYRKRRPVNEQTPVGEDYSDRGPYVWGKAESEALMTRQSASAAIDLRIIRPGPLVDYGDFQPPGRLGREIGPIFVAIGGRNSALHVCDVRTVARVIRSYVEDFDAAPPVLNLTEDPPPSRRELMARHLARRNDLRAWWFPGWLLRLLNGPAKLAQRMLGSRQPIDLYAAFASGNYSTELAARAIEKAGPGRAPAI